MKAQGEAYKKFNSEMLELFEPAKIVTVKSSKKGKDQVKSEVNVDKSIEFRKLNEKIESCTYFNQKYNLDMQFKKLHGS